MALSTGTMLNYLHFPSSSSGDTLWFPGWVSHAFGGGGAGRWGGVGGVCVGLFLLALAERCVAGVEGVARRGWERRAHALHPPAPTSAPTTAAAACKTRGHSSITSRLPSMSIILGLGQGRFIPAHDFPRAIFHVVRALIGVLFMWTVMTFQVAFILSIIVGLGVGEVLFGRYANSQAHLC